jgi:hypothetical protein
MAMSGLQTCIFAVNTVLPMVRQRRNADGHQYYIFPKGNNNDSRYNDWKGQKGTVMCDGKCTEEDHGTDIYRSEKAGEDGGTAGRTSEHHEASVRILPDTDEIVGRRTIGPVFPKGMGMSKL